MTAPVVDYKIHWLIMMSVPESRAVVGRHDGINGTDRAGDTVIKAIDLQVNAALILAAQPLGEITLLSRPSGSAPGRPTPGRTR